MRDHRNAIFLARETYRHRRTTDMARLLPLFGALLFMLPLLWSGARTSTGVVYLFAVWAGLILAAALLARRLMRAETAERGGKPGATVDSEPD